MRAAAAAPEGRSMKGGGRTPPPPGTEEPTRGSGRAAHCPVHAASARPTVAATERFRRRGIMSDGGVASAEGSGEGGSSLTTTGLSPLRTNPRHSSPTPKAWLRQSSAATTGSAVPGTCTSRGFDPARSKVRTRPTADAEACCKPPPCRPEPLPLRSVRSPERGMGVQGDTPAPAADRPMRACAHWPARSRAWAREPCSSNPDSM